MGSQVWVQRSGEIRRRICTGEFSWTISMINLKEIAQGVPRNASGALLSESQRTKMASSRRRRSTAFPCRRMTERKASPRTICRLFLCRTARCLLTQDDSGQNSCMLPAAMLVSCIYSILQCFMDQSYILLKGQDILPTYTMSQRYRPEDYTVFFINVSSFGGWQHLMMIAADRFGLTCGQTCTFHVPRLG